MIKLSSFIPACAVAVALAACSGGPGADQVGSDFGPQGVFSQIHADPGPFAQAGQDPGPFAHNAAGLTDVAGGGGGAGGATGGLATTSGSGTGTVGGDTGTIGGETGSSATAGDTGATTAGDTGLTTSGTTGGSCSACTQYESGTDTASEVCFAACECHCMPTLCTEAGTSEQEVLSEAALLGITCSY